MDFRFSDEDEILRREVRDFFREHLPKDWKVRNDREAETEEDFALSRTLAQELAARGWLTLAWPRSYGGLGASAVAQMIYNEELGYAGAPLGFGFGPNLVGPTLMAWGSDEQQRRHLPPIASGDLLWCQGFSEPGAGSDLASLETRAIRSGDDYLISGQKIWTSEGHRASWMILLARTDPQAPKHRGISYFLVDMHSPGVSVQPLVNLMNGHSFNQVFFDNVRVPRENLVGEENRGWYVATTTLDFERSGINRISWARRQFEDLTELLALRGAVRSQARGTLAGLAVELQVARLLCYRVAFLQAQGRVPNYESSMAKLFGTEVIARIAGAGIGLLGLSGQLEPESRATALQGRLERSYLAATSYTIAGGTSEVQRGVIATRGLGLPR
jgi:alkylation response protein AidB-like acyl-CoA dehydrogenase